SRAGADDEGGDDDALFNRGVGVFDTLHQIIDALFAEQIKILADGGQWWLEMTGFGNIIETDDGNICGDAQTAFMDGSHRAQRHLVIGDDEGGKSCSAFQEMTGCPITANSCPIA